ncbi:hypothetical protein BpHYR1_005543 [Brachionus plicatilis]|uniref:Uncharacterized protein n=1 Tax=Brachionus plicatilis TaxID=10195 RepID=A0A3M7SGX3_BRAPC|nr:hypothetical protein BpHYR1_005543 [Brachionus plicatilis]
MNLKSGLGEFLKQTFKKYPERLRTEKRIKNLKVLVTNNYSIVFIQEFLKITLLNFAILRKLTTKNVDFRPLLLYFSNFSKKLFLFYHYYLIYVYKTDWRIQPSNEKIEYHRIIDHIMHQISKKIVIKKSLKFTKNICIYALKN